MKEYCKVENGVISRPQELPSSYSNVVIGFNHLPDDELVKYGFYPFLLPEKSTEQVYGSIYFDADTEIVTRWVEDAYMTIEEARAEKIKIAKLVTRDRLAETGWYLEREYERGIPIPDKVKAARFGHLDNCDAYEDRVNACETLEEVLALEFE